MLSDELVDQFLDQWYWIFILHCIFIKFTIVLYWFELAILLFDKEKRGSIG